MPLKRWQRWTFSLTGLVMMAALAAFVLECKTQAHILVTNPMATRKVPTRTPAAFHLAYDDVEVTTSDGLVLPGWWIPPTGRGVIILVHGYKGHRGQLLGVAEVLHRHGYGLLIAALRAHDRSGGELISFGNEETRDLDAWTAYLDARGDVDPARVGMLGVSMGGEIAIKYAAQHAGIRALVADCAFSSVDETVATSVRYFTGLPAFPFAPMIRFWIDRELGFDSSQLDAKQWIPEHQPASRTGDAGRRGCGHLGRQRPEALRGGPSAEGALVRADRRPREVLRDDAQGIRAPRRRVFQSVSCGHGKRTMKPWITGLIMMVCAVGGLTALRQAPPPDIVFFDDFAAPALDRAKWNVMVSGRTVNNEQQAYIDSTEVLRTSRGADAAGAENGALIIQPRFRAAFMTPENRRFDFTSGRLESRDKVEFTYGTASARIKLTAGAGLWPAFWALGTGRWPDTGEMDIMENVGDPGWTNVALHGPGYSGNTPFTARRPFTPANDITGWHIYSMAWTSSGFVFKVDDDAFYKPTREMVEKYGRWAYDNPKFLILNFALGGQYPQAVNHITAPYPGLAAETVDLIKANKAMMIVDWVKVTRENG